MVRSRPISIDDGLLLDDPIAILIGGDFRWPETKEIFHCPIKSLCIEDDLRGTARDLVAPLGMAGRLAVVSDPDTYDALGDRLVRELPDADLVLLRDTKADEAGVATLLDETRHFDSLIAVGSGTLNDLCKYVSHQRRRPYAVFPTAPSMNGYTTATASISQGGEKQSLPAPPPIGVFFDLSVLAKAPSRLIQAGVGDSLCRSTAQVDWLLSHRLLGTAYSATPFLLQRKAEQALLDRAGQLNGGDLGIMRSLAQLLVIGGLGMLLVGNSQPGSQGEHLISHYIDMFCRPHPGTLHGEQVGLATWTMAQLQHAVIDQAEPPRLGATSIDQTSIKARYGALHEACRRAIDAKVISGKKLSAMNGRLTQHWPSLREELRAATLPLDQLKRALDAAGVATEASALGLDQAFYANAVMHARELRDRYTMLDLAADAGLLVPFIKQHIAG